MVSKIPWIYHILNSYITNLCSFSISIVAFVFSSGCCHCYWFNIFLHTIHYQHIFRKPSLSVFFIVFQKTCLQMLDNFSDILVKFQKLYHKINFKKFKGSPCFPFTKYGIKNWQHYVHILLCNFLEFEWENVSNHLKMNILNIHQG